MISIKKFLLLFLSYISSDLSAGPFKIYRSFKPQTGNDLLSTYFVVDTEGGCEYDTRRFASLIKSLDPLYYTRYVEPFASWNSIIFVTQNEPSRMAEDEVEKIFARVRKTNAADIAALETALAKARSMVGSVGPQSLAIINAKSQKIVNDVTDLLKNKWPMALNSQFNFDNFKQMINEKLFIPGEALMRERVQAVNDAVKQNYLLRLRRENGQKAQALLQKLQDALNAQAKSSDLSMYMMQLQNFYDNNKCLVDKKKFDGAVSNFLKTIPEY